jgi:glycosyltransferase involved in cell wall biosynthesis
VTEHRPVRVLALVKGLGPGGAERLLVSAGAAHDTTRTTMSAAYVLPHKDHLVDELRAHAIEVTCLAGRRGLLDWRWPIQLRRLVRRDDIDVVHLHSPAVAAIARLALVGTGAVRMSTEHNVWSSYGPATRVANALTAPLDRARLAVSNEVRESTWRPWRRRVEVLLHGVPLAQLSQQDADRDATRAELGADDQDIVIGTIANLREGKDYPTLFAAAALALATEPRLRFVAVGQGQLESDLRAELATFGLGERFLMLGYRYDATRVLAACDLFTLTSVHEGLPIALLEALALGLPSVVTAAGGTVAVVTDGREGVLVPPSRPDLLAAAYVSLARDAERRDAMSAAARRRALDFDIERAARRLEDLYEAVSRPPRGRDRRRRTSGA